jgi:OOP family OmpA-OmpF porin
MTAAAAHAQFTFDTSGALPEGWYVAPMFSYDFADTKRCTDDGPGGVVNVGNRGKQVSFEFGVQYIQLPYDCTYANEVNPTPVTESGDARLLGTELSALFGPYTDMPVLRQTHGIAGVGAMRHENHPRFATDDTNFFGDLGVGYLQPFTAWGWGATLRAEARYRYEHEQSPRFNGVPASFRDVIFNIGLQIPLFASEAAVPPPAQEGVGVVPAGEGKPEPAPAPAAEAPAPAVAPTAAESDAGAVIGTAKAGDTVVLHGVTFDTGKATLTANAQTVLDGVATQLTQRPELKVEVGGHTDSRGKTAGNLKLSGRRAQAVLDYLVLKGVDAGRLTAKGYGAEQPVDSNDTDEGREHNRRVELKVL